MSTHKPVDWTKELQTKGGHRARLLGVLNTAAEYKYVVAVATTEGPEWVSCFNKSGTYGSDTRYDPINPPSRIKREAWANVYGDDMAMNLSFFYTRNHADESADPRRLACVKVTIDCAEGEGL